MTKSEKELKEKDDLIGQLQRDKEADVKKWKLVLDNKVHGAGGTRTASRDVHGRTVLASWARYGFIPPPPLGACRARHGA